MNTGLFLTQNISFFTGRLQATCNFIEPINEAKYTHSETLSGTKYLLSTK